MVWRFFFRKEAFSLPGEMKAIEGGPLFVFSSVTVFRCRSGLVHLVDMINIPVMLVMVNPICFPVLEWIVHYNPSLCLLNRSLKPETAPSEMAVAEGQNSENFHGRRLAEWDTSQEFYPLPIFPPPHHVSRG